LIVAAKKVLFLLPYPLRRAPSQRFRAEAFFNKLEENEIAFDTHTFLDESGWEILYQKGSVMRKAAAVVKGFLKRAIYIATRAGAYHYVYIHREAAPLGPPVFEWMLRFLFRRKIIYDFDDAIWIPNVSGTNGLARFAKSFWKVGSVCRWSYKIAAGNDYLAAYARRFNSNVFVIPTNVNMTDRYNRMKHHNSGPVVIGWTGSHSTLKYLDLILPVLRKLEKKYTFTFLVICDERPTFQLASLQYRPWNSKTEIEDLMQIDIGLMPLEDDPWSEGKCGFKIIQYLALGIPAVASPVGVNKTIIEEGRNGFLCTTEEEWCTRIELLMHNPALRGQLGEAGRRKMQQQFSIDAHAGNFISLFS
jgi:glycosyltransferase involved in cell wall biosynthesis